MKQEYIKEISIKLIAKTLLINLRVLLLSFIPFLVILTSAIFIYNAHRHPQYTTTGVIQVSNLYPISYSMQQEINASDNNNSSVQHGYTYGEATNSEIVASLLTTEYILKKVINDNLLDVSYVPYYATISDQIRVLLGFTAKPTLKISKFVLYDLRYTNQDLKIEFTSNKDYKVSYNGYTIARGVIGQLLVTKEFSLLIASFRGAANSSFLLKKSSLDIIIAKLIKQIAIEPILINKKSDQADTGIIKVSITGYNPNLQANLINDMINEAKMKSLDQQRQAINQTVQFIDSQIIIAKNNFESSQDELVAFQKSHRIVAMEDQARLDLNKLSDLDSKILDKQITLDQFKNLYTAKHPYMVGLKQQADALIMDKLKVEKSLSNLPLDEANYIHLKRRVEVSQQFYLSLMAKDQNLRIIYSGITSPVQVLNYATPLVAKILEPVTVRVIALCFFGLLLLEIFIVMYFTLWINADPYLFPYLVDVPLLSILPHKMSKRSMNINDPRFSIMASYFLDNLSKFENNLICNISSISNASGKSFIIAELIKYFSTLDKKSLYLEFSSKRDSLTIAEAWEKLELLDMSKIEHTNFLRIRINSVSHFDMDKLQHIIFKLKNFNFIFIESPAVLKNPSFMHLTKIAHENMIITTPGDTKHQIEMVTQGFLNLSVTLTRVIFNHPKKTLLKSIYSVDQM